MRGGSPGGRAGSEAWSAPGRATPPGAGGGGRRRGCARAPPGPPAAPATWDERDLPAPSARAVVANIEDRDAFAGRVRAEADRLGATAAADVTVLGDGAEWLWTLAADVFPQATGV